MRAPSSAAIFAAALLLSLTAHADPALVQLAHARGITLGLTAVQPLPPWNDAGFGVAPWAGFATPVSRSLLATARVGYVAHRHKVVTVGSDPTESITYSSWELPVLAGIESLPAGEHGLFVFGELGYVLQHTRAEYPHEPAATATDHGAGIGIGGGYRIGGFQARVQYFMLGLPDPVKQKAIVFGVQWLLPI